MLLHTTPNNGRISLTDNKQISCFMPSWQSLERVFIHCWVSAQVCREPDPVETSLYAHAHQNTYHLLEGGIPKGILGLEGPWAVHFLVLHRLVSLSGSCHLRDSCCGGRKTRVLPLGGSRGIVEGSRFSFYALTREQQIEMTLLLSRVEHLQNWYWMMGSASPIVLNATAPHSVLPNFSLFLSLDSL